MESVVLVKIVRIVRGIVGGARRRLRVLRHQAAAILVRERQVVEDLLIVMRVAEMGSVVLVRMLMKIVRIVRGIAGLVLRLRPRRLPAQ